MCRWLFLATEPVGDTRRRAFWGLEMVGDVCFQQFLVTQLGAVACCCSVPVFEIAHGMRVSAHFRVAEMMIL